MKQESLVHNPFMMMLQPEVVVAAMERSEKLGRLNRRLCQPLDRVAGPAAEGAKVAGGEVDKLDD
jgi:hypothetical protein